MAWLMVVVAGLFETGFAVLLKQSHGITRLWPTVSFAICALISFALLTAALKKLEVGSAYAVWTGLGAAGTAVVAVDAAGIAYPFYPRHLTIVSTLTIGVPGFFLALAAGAPRARPGFTRRVLAFTIPAGIAAAAAALGSYALARAADGVSAQEARTAAMLALLAVALWVLGIVAGRVVWRAALVTVMSACLVPLFTVPLARTVFAVQLPPVSVLLQVAGVVLAAIAALTLWRRRPAG